MTVTPGRHATPDPSPTPPPSRAKGIALDLAVKTAAYAIFSLLKHVAQDLF